MEKDQKKPQPLKKPTLKEETLNKETLDILKKINTGVSKISLVNKNVLKINDGVKSLNAKIVNTNLGVKSMNMKLAKIDVNMAKLLNAMAKQKGKNGKGVSYLDEQLQNETLAQAKKTNVTLDKILVAVSKNGTTIKKDGGSGLLDGLLAVTGLKMLGGLINKVLKGGKIAGGVAVGMGGAGVLRKVLGKGGAKGADSLGGRLLKSGAKKLWLPGLTLGAIPVAKDLMNKDYTNAALGGAAIAAPVGGAAIGTSIVPGPGTLIGGIVGGVVGVAIDFFKEDIAGALKGTGKEIEKGITDALPEINITQRDWWKDTLGGAGEVFYDMIRNHIKDIGNMFDEPSKRTLMGLADQDWMKMETWEKLYSDPDSFMKKMGEVGMRLNAAAGSLDIPSLGVPPYSGSGARGKTTIPANIESIIKDTAKQYGLSEDYMKTMASIESSFDPNAHNEGSGAKGLYQFIPNTAKEYGIVGNEFDAKTSADAAARLTLNNIKTLKARGVPITEENLYLAHQQGATGAADLYAASRGEIDVSDAMRKRIESNLPYSMKGKNISPAQFIAYYNKKYRNTRDRIKGTESLSAAPEKQFSINQPQDPVKHLVDLAMGAESNGWSFGDIDFIKEITDRFKLAKQRATEMGSPTIRRALTNSVLFPSKEAPTTNQLQNSAIEKDKLSMSSPELQQPNMVNQVVNNNGGGQDSQQLNSFSPFDIYNKGLNNPYLGKV